MQSQRMLVIIVAALTLASCATLGIPTGAQDAFEEGLALFNRGQYEEAAPHFQKATEIDPEFYEAYLYLGRSYLNLARWNDAIGPLRTALRLSPQDAHKEVLHILIDALYGAAVHEFKKGHFRASIGHFKEVLQLDPQYRKAKDAMAGALMGLGGELLKKGHAKAAIDTFSEALELSPDDIQAYLGLARALVEHGDLVKALQTVKDALKIDPRNQEIRSLLKELMR